MPVWGATVAWWLEVRALARQRGRVDATIYHLRVAFWLAADRIYNPGPIAASYAEIASTLAGFAVAGLIVYMGLERRSRLVRLCRDAPRAV
jgi:hypothetical protein